MFIKLDAIGDVLRSASLLPVIAAHHDHPYIAWLTRKDSFELVAMMKYVDEVIELSAEGIARIVTGGWDHVYSLSNDLPSASIASMCMTKNKPIGFYISSGVVTPSNEAAEHWLQMAAFDRLKCQNQQSYQELMLSIIGRPGAKVASPELELDRSTQTAAATRVSELFGGRPRQRVAINVGAGMRWPKKMLDAEQIYRYACLLIARANVDVLLVGGGAEKEKTEAIIGMCSPGDRIRAALTQNSLQNFVATLAQVDALLCGDTFALHVATALHLPTVAVFGPTSSAEVYDYDGLVAKTWTRELECLVCYGDCSKRVNCMTLTDLASLVDLTLQQLKRASAQRPRLDSRRRESQ